MTMTRSIITLEQINQYKRFVEEAADKALAELGLDRNELQKLINNGDELLRIYMIINIKNIKIDYNVLISNLKNIQMQTMNTKQLLLPLFLSHEEQKLYLKTVLI